MAGPLKTLFGALQASQYMTGVSLAFGLEGVHDLALPLPLVVAVPTTGAYLDSPGYSTNLDTGILQIWAVNQSVDLYLWAFSTAAGATGIDHADAIEDLRIKVLSALQDQRAQYSDVVSVAHGLWFKPISERWQLMEGAWMQYGRALVITVQAEVPLPMAMPQEATITSYQISQSITVGP